MGFVIMDIETRVDKVLLRDALYPGATPEEAYEQHCAELREKYGSDFVSIPFHVPIVIALGVVDAQYKLSKVETLVASTPDEERAIVEEFWRRHAAFAAKKGTLVTFNGRGFDVPVLELRALHHRIAIGHHTEPKYGARYRFQTDHHLDLQEFLDNYGATRLRGGLDVLLRLCGLSGKGEVHGSDVQRLYEAGKLDRIARYCAHDVVGTFILFLRVQIMRGLIQADLAETALSASSHHLG